MCFSRQYLLETIYRICANRDWRLLTHADLAATPDDFAGRVSVRLQGWLDAGEYPEITKRQIEAGIINEYCRLLHHAVALERTAAQQRALDEIWNYVTPIIRRVLRDEMQATACANDVLLAVWRKRGDVHDPGSFLGWAAMIASRAACKMARDAVGREITFSDMIGDDKAADDGEWGETQANAATALLADKLSAFTALEGAEIVATLATLIRQCLSRMRSGAEVIIRLVLAEQPVSEVSQALGVSVANIYVIKLRALARLRRCEALLAALNEALTPAARNMYGGSR